MGVENWEKTEDDGNKGKQPGLGTVSQNATLLLEARIYVNRAPNYSSRPRSAPLFFHVIHGVFVSDLTSANWSQKNPLYSWLKTFSIDRRRLETSSLLLLLRLS